MKITGLFQYSGEAGSWAIGTHRVARDNTCNIKTIYTDRYRGNQVAQGWLEMFNGTNNTSGFKLYFIY